VVTGGGSGIGRALATRFAAEGAAGVAVADLEPDRIDQTVTTITDAGGRAIPFRCDVSVEADVQALVDATVEAFGPGRPVLLQRRDRGRRGVEAPDADWQRIWDVNVMAHVYAARAVLPSMLERGDGYLLNTASAAGLLTNLGAAPYAVTKHAAVALAEWLAVTHGDDGIKVSCLCPQGVATRMLLGDDAEAIADGAAPPGGDDAGQSSVLAAGAVLTPAQVAEAVVAGIAAERFLILPHPEVGGYYAKKAADPDRWIGGMRRFQPGSAPGADDHRDGCARPPVRPAGTPGPQGGARATERTPAPGRGPCSSGARHGCDLRDPRRDLGAAYRRDHITNL
jgi:NAD(P)-dependent dehydrogenase (short-subunit alcohol dehydrogenase family)